MAWVPMDSSANDGNPAGKQLKLIIEKMNKKIILLVFTLFVSSASIAQELQAVEDAASSLSSFLGENKDRITSVRVVSDTEQGLKVEVSYAGFDDDKYKISGVIMNRIKQPLKQIRSEPQQLNNSRSSVELGFQFDASAFGANRPYLQSEFLQLSIYKANDLLGNLDLDVGGFSGETFLYKHSKQWRIGGNERMVITVKLTPYQSARTIKR